MQLDRLELAKGLEHLADVVRRQGKVERADVQPARAARAGSVSGRAHSRREGGRERDAPARHRRAAAPTAARTAAAGPVARLAVLLGLGVLDLDRDPEELGPRERERLLHRLELDKLDVADSAYKYLKA